jgi:hypothetical protein
VLVPRSGSLNILCLGTCIRGSTTAHVTSDVCEAGGSPTLQTRKPRLPNTQSHTGQSLTPALPRTQLRTTKMQRVHPR